MKKNKTEGGSLFLEAVVRKICDKAFEIKELEAKLAQRNDMLFLMLPYFTASKVYYCIDCENWFNCGKDTSALPDCWFCDCGNYDFHCGCTEMELWCDHCERDLCEVCVMGNSETDLCFGCCDF